MQHEHPEEVRAAGHTHEAREDRVVDVEARQRQEEHREQVDPVGDARRPADGPRGRVCVTSTSPPTCGCRPCPACRFCVQSRERRIRFKDRSCGRCAPLPSGCSASMHGAPMRASSIGPRTPSSSRGLMSHVDGVQTW